MLTYDILDIYRLVYNKGVESKPRDLKIKEINYFQGEITNPWSNHIHRNYPINYLKREMCWYLKADKYDLSICEHAKAWEKLIQPDGSILSNYGQYWFPDGFNWVVSILRSDPDSRQAIIPMLSKDHIFYGNKDVVCTQGIHFLIRDSKLDIVVTMRSSDIVFGLATDLPCFWILARMVANALGIPAGRFIFQATSLHVYERHFKMIEKVLKYPNMYRIDCPEVDDAYDLINLKYESKFGRWLNETK